MVFVLQTFLQIYDLTCKIRTIEQKSYIFYKLPIRMNLHEWPTPNPAPKHTISGV